MLLRNLFENEEIVDFKIKKDWIILENSKKEILLASINDPDNCTDWFKGTYTIKKSEIIVLKRSDGDINLASINNLNNCTCWFPGTYTITESAIVLECDDGDFCLASPDLVTQTKWFRGTYEIDDDGTVTYRELGESKAFKY